MHFYLNWRNNFKMKTWFLLLTMNYIVMWKNLYYFISYLTKVNYGPIHLHVMNVTHLVNQWLELRILVLATQQMVWSVAWKISRKIQTKKKNWIIHVLIIILVSCTKWFVKSMVNAYIQEFLVARAHSWQSYRVISKCQVIILNIEHGNTFCNWNLNYRWT